MDVRLSRTPIGRRAFLLAGSATALVAALPAKAHHGWSSFDSDVFELTGTVERVYFGNPHGELNVRAEDGVWEVGLGPPSRNSRAGLNETTVKVGDMVTAIGKRHRDSEVLAMKTERLIVGDKTYDIYPERLKGS